MATQQIGEAGALTAEEIKEVAELANEKKVKTASAAAGRDGSRIGNRALPPTTLMSRVTQESTGIGSMDAARAEHELNGHMAGNPQQKERVQTTFKLRNEPESSGGFMSYLLWIVVIAVVVVGAFFVKAHLDKKKKQDRFSF